MKWLVSGCDGGLAYEVIARLTEMGEEVVGLNRLQLDVTNPSAMEIAFEMHKPDVYYHGASIHVVDHIQSNPQKAWTVNVGALAHACELAKKYRTRVVNISTNYVFGEDNLSVLEAYREEYTEHTDPQPDNLYGLSKLQGEEVGKHSGRCQSFRVAGLFGKVGSSAKDGSNFPYIILNQLKDWYPGGQSLVSINDQFMNFTYTKDAAKQIVHVASLEAQCKGCIYSDTALYHVCNKGRATWFEVAEFIAQLKGKYGAYVPCTTEEFHKDDIPRPKWTPIKTALNQPKMSTWQNAIVRFLHEIGEIE